MLRLVGVPIMPAGDAASYVSTEMQFAIIKKIESLNHRSINGLGEPALGDSH
jgi:hypothetical protein